MLSLKSIYQSIVNGSEEEETSKRIETVNLIAILCAIIVTIYGYWFYCVSNAIEILIPALLFCPAFLFVFALNKHRFHLAARILLQVVFSGIISYYGIVLGRLAFVELFAVFAINIILLTFQTNELKWMILCTVLHISNTIFLEFNYAYNIFPSIPLTENIQSLFRWLIISVIFFLNLVAMVIYQLKSLRLSKKIAAYTKELDDKNQQLYTFNEELAETVKVRTAALNLANASKTKFLNQISHETRNSLNQIVGQTTLLLESMQKKAVVNEDVSLVEGIYYSGVSLREILNNVLSLSHIEAGKITVVNAAPFNLMEWLEENMNVYRNFARSKHINLFLKASPSLPRSIVSDKVKLTQMFNNLVSNAIKVTPNFQTVLVEVYCRETQWYIRITDEGSGIEPAKISALFMPFNQIDKNADHYNGSGLGLFLTKTFADMLGGNIYVDGNNGKGATFTISLPLIIHEEEIILKEEPTIVLPRGKKVLLVEDDAINRMIVSRFLEETGLLLATAENGTEGVEMAVQFEPDLIIMDMNMPIMDGREAILILRQMPQFKHTPIVALSANGFKEDEALAIELGVNYYITKPVLKPHLLSTLSKMLNGTPAQTV
ncbi:signal transduction histidine kinase [Chitinophaga skermanii]|uniref:histidine kinase n=1 Tax=Chitinophaga skermanii TaxID=331697 RepID=A0A327QR74_9BACT|nr:response regulator [Chitinophaga skermanii]RAJ06820.1 signal transduction histidine kinase [Chitinophaga skermanii]